jgi:hypothetical protein
MAEKMPQTLANHTRWDPLFHFFILPVAFISVIVSVVHFVRVPSFDAGWVFVGVTAATVAAVKCRLYALKVQDRVIRMEERQRMAMLLPETLRGRVGELSASQMVALRFASDGELAGLVGRVLAEKLSRADIKKSIQQWRPDYWRV